MARSEGFEPPTPRFEVWCSIQLSYERLELCSEEPIKFQMCSRDHGASASSHTTRTKRSGRASPPATAGHAPCYDRGSKAAEERQWPSPIYRPSPGFSV